MTENYKEVKNYIHNELKITKEDINKIIMDTIKEEVHKVFKNEEYIKDCIRGIVYKEVNKEMFGENAWHTIHDISGIIKDDINTAICEEVKKRINISLKEDV